jgi:hypothetical protein
MLTHLSGHSLDALKVVVIGPAQPIPNRMGACSFEVGLDGGHKIAVTFANQAEADAARANFLNAVEQSIRVSAGAQ